MALLLLYQAAPRNVERSVCLYNWLRYSVWLSSSSSEISQLLLGPDFAKKGVPRRPRCVEGVSIRMYA